jgi:tRNA-2-methylthio-N6-dimethylallyladenosine synthase
LKHQSESRKPEAESLVRITGLDDRETDACFETEFTARTNPHGYITIIEGCDKFAPTASCPTRAARNAAGRRSRCSLKRARG